MYKEYSACLACVVVVLFLTVPAVGQPWGVMKVGTMVGNSTIDGYAGWCDILSYSLSVQNGGWNIYGDPLPASLSDMFVTKQLDIASPLLFGAVLTQQHFNDEWVFDAQIHVLATGLEGVPQAYVKWLFNDVVVSGYNTVYEGSLPLELVAIDYGEITYEYYPTNPDGSPGSPVSFTYDRHVGAMTWSGDMVNGFQLVTQFQSVNVPEPGALLLVLGCLSLAIWRTGRVA
jgi:type VI protein secretion system component Hcp